jgi:hypothetical protein
MDLQSIIRNGGWHLVDVLVAIFLFASGYVLSRKHQRKSLSYEIRSFDPLLSVRDDMEGKLKITFGDMPVSKVHLAIIKVINTGYVSIKKEDFDEPLRMNFGKDARILAADIIDTNPKDLPAEEDIGAIFSEDVDNVTLTPLLLNRKDSVTFKLIVSNAADVCITGRIMGVRAINRMNMVERSRRQSNMLWATIFGLVLSYLILDLVHDTLNFGLAMLVALLLSVVIFGFGQTWDRRFRISPEPPAM